MSMDIQEQVAATTARLRELEIQENLTAWDAAVKGTPENLGKAADARTARMNYLADPALYAQFRDWDRAQAAQDDALLARQLRILHNGFALGQNDPELIAQISGIIQKVEEVYYGFRAEISGGKKLSNNEIDKILEDSRDSEVRREVWEAHKQLGPLVATSVRELARLRNVAAQKMGYANFHQMSLMLNEIDPQWLYAMLDDLASATDAPFRRVKGNLDAELSRRFNVPVAALRPWHYSDLFFQRAPKVGQTDFDEFFKDQDVVALATKTYDSLGMEVRDVLARSDLYERELKDQHAFAMHVDREGDVRTLNNIVPSERWQDTILHELGHCVYDKYIPKSLPWLLRTIPHILTTEAMALLMGGQTLDREWLVRIRGLDPATADAAAGAARDREILGQLIFARWVMVVVGFERAIYEDPEQDLDSVWWNLVERYQFLTRPEGRQMPDWATKNHIALVPAYYQNYLIGHMVAAQWQHVLDARGGLIGNTGAGDWFREKVFATGATLPWPDALAYATGEPLNMEYYVASYVTA